MDTVERNCSILKAYSMDKPVSDIAAVHDVSRSTVYNVIAMTKPAYWRNCSKKVQQTIVDLYKQDYDSHAIASFTHIRMDDVVAFLLCNSLKPNDPGWSNEPATSPSEVTTLLTDLSVYTMISEYLKHNSRITNTGAYVDLTLCTLFDADTKITVKSMNTILSLVRDWLMEHWMDGEPTIHDLLLAYSTPEVADDYQSGDLPKPGNIIVVGDVCLLLCDEQGYLLR